MPPMRRMGKPAKPKDTKATIRRILSYMLRRKLLLLAVMIFVLISSLAGVIGTYMLRPIINDCIIPMVEAQEKDFGPLIRMLSLMGGVYLAGALASLWAAAPDDPDHPRDAKFRPSRSFQ